MSQLYEDCDCWGTCHADDGEVFGWCDEYLCVCPGEAEDVRDPAKCAVMKDAYKAGAVIFDGAVIA